MVRLLTGRRGKAPLGVNNSNNTAVQQPQQPHSRPGGARWLIVGCFLTGVHLLATVPKFAVRTELLDVTSASPPEPLYLPPPQCSSEQSLTIRRQLPEGDCRATALKPWVNQCSFSYATRCPDAVWLTEQYRPRRSSAAAAIRSTAAAAPPIHPARIAIYVGCNKAMDAVNSLRMLTGDATYDRNQWRDSFFEGQTYEAGRCGQESTAQFEIVSGGGGGVQSSTTAAAIVHCIEPMPVTAARLSHTVNALGWQDTLIVSNVAVSDTDGSVLFPNVGGKVGVENMGIENCQGTDAEKFCKTVPLYRLDTFAELNLPKNHSLIDFLSVDVEGFDYDVLLGAPQLLQRTKYLEFEYNWKGNWKVHKLSTAIAMLHDEAGFVCYWAGAFGHIWRITDCWQDYYDLKHWSNVACVNARLPESAALAVRMEELFQKTLHAGNSIHYFNEATANTDGGFQESTKVR